MTNAMLNTQLYQKMYAEQEQYKAYLLTLPPAEILDHASEYICRENILMAMDNNNLSNARAKALLKSSTPLVEVYNKYAGWDHSRQQKKFGMQLKPVPVRYCEQSLPHPREQKGRQQYAIHSTRNH